MGPAMNHTKVEEAGILPFSESSPARPLLLLDGVESATGRALMTISALYWSLDWLDGATPHLVGVIDPDVVLAAQAFVRDTGARLSWSADTLDLFKDARLYAGIAFRSGAHMQLDAARRRRVPVVLAVQYPDENWLTASTVIHQPLAFDPRRFAQHLGATFRSLS